MTISKLQLAAAEQAAYQRGFTEGLDRGVRKAEQDLAYLRGEAFVKLVNAAGQAMNANAAILQGLSNTFDCSGQVK